VSIFANIPPLDLLALTSGMAAITGFALLQAIKEEDPLLAYVWGAMFGLTSLAAAWSLWRMV
jgi:hypothetical protein